MAKDIFKRLLFTFLISFGISMTYAGINYQATEGFDARQGEMVVVIMCVILNIINFILSLAAFLYLNDNVRESAVTSFLSFMGLPVLLLVLLAKAFLTAEGHENELFFPIGLPSICYCIMMAYHYYRVRKKWSKTYKNTAE